MPPRRDREVACVGELFGRPPCCIQGSLFVLLSVQAWRTNASAATQTLALIRADGLIL